MLSELSSASIQAKLNSACAGRTWRAESHKHVAELLRSYHTHQKAHFTRLLEQTRIEGRGTCVSVDQSHKQSQQTAQTPYEISELPVLDTLILAQHTD